MEHSNSAAEKEGTIPSHSGGSEPPSNSEASRSRDKTPSRPPKRPGPYQRPHGGKRPNTNSGTRKPPPQRSQLETAPTVTLSPLTPVVPYVGIPFSFDGIEILTSRYYSYLRGKDAKLADTITLATLQYVTFFVAYTRALFTRTGCALEFHANILTLTSIASSIKLPQVLLKYAEAIGTFKLANGVTIAPILPAEAQLNEYVEQLFEAGGRHFADSYIDTQWIVQYSNAIGRHEKAGLKFEALSFTQPIVGREEFLTSYEEEDQPIYGIRRIKAFAPQVMSGASADLGAIYRFRTREQATGILLPFLEGQFFVEDVLLTGILSA